jgi:hypothetical protein
VYRPMPCDVRKMALLHSFHHISNPAPVMCATPFNVSAIADIMEKELWDDDDDDDMVIDLSKSIKSSREVGDYYNKLDLSPAYSVVTLLHPRYKT